MTFPINDVRRLIKEAIRKAYDILGVPQNATPEEIKKAYIRKAIGLHPDRNPGVDTTAGMAKLNVAYGLLSDPTEKRRYDFEGSKTLGDNDLWNRQQSSSTRPKPPPPQPRPSGSRTRGQDQRGYTYSRTKSDRQDFIKKTLTTKGVSTKFWWIDLLSQKRVQVGWGRVGTIGVTKTYTFASRQEAVNFYNKKISEKTRKGYTYTKQRHGQSSSSNVPPRQSPPRQPKPKQQQAKQPSKNAGQPGVSNRQYKVYGKKAGSPAHTRYKGVVYLAPNDTKFRPGMKANVGLGSDGRLSVNDPESGNTQAWRKEEAMRRRIDTLLAEIYLR